jgi:flagellar L-ring protein precursor FlgH
MDRSPAASGLASSDGSGSQRPKSTGNHQVPHAQTALLAILVGSAGAGLLAVSARAEDLFVPGTTQSLSSDRHAAAKGDLITIVIVQAAESSTSVQSGSQRSSAANGHLGIGSIDESADLSLGGSYTGRGELRRSERFVTQMTASIADVLPNGDFLIGGTQRLNVDGESTIVEVRGRIRPSDIDSDNRVASNRIAEAQINYNGKGFVSRSSRPGFLQRLFGLLGLI